MLGPEKTWEVARLTKSSNILPLRRKSIRRSSFGRACASSEGMTKLGICIAAIMAVSAAAAQPGASSYGERPHWPRAIAKGNEAIEWRLRPKTKPHIAWPRPFARGTLTLPGLPRLRGWYTCGKLELPADADRNIARDVLIMFKGSHLVLLEIASPDGIDRPTTICSGLAPPGWLGP